MIALAGSHRRGVHDRKAELGIFGAGAGAAAARDDEQPAVDLLPPVHARGILLADEAALGEADAVQLGRIAFEPEDVAKLRPPFGDAEAQAVVEPAARGLARGASQRRPSAGRRGSATP